MKLTAILTAVMLVLALSACTATGTESVAAKSQPAPQLPVEQTPEQNVAQATQPALLTRQEAIDAALKAAGVKEVDIRDLDAELDRERGTSVWEVDFEAGRTEYSFVLDATTGKILHQEKEIDD
ncbi:MAG: PepSY domain-containing protein [Oscillospiraceae bacterium]|nr:PepSY domain-containing protein [Oscillospiraceae bacterium]